MTLLTLFSCISNGVDWWEVGEFLMKISPFVGIMFILYIAVMTLGILNIITGLFVENTAHISKIDRHIVVESEVKANLGVINELRVMFLELDKEKTGFLSMDDFKAKTASG